jgi:rhomboid protease GluP
MTEPRVITADMLEPVDDRIEFEKGMSWAPPATLVLIGLYVVTFIWQVATGALASQEAILAAGALDGGAVARGEVWRLVSATFLHGGIEHLFGNAIMFYIVGIGLEHALGTRQMLWVYSVAGLGGSVLSALLTDGPSVGASGAIFGVMTGLVAVLHRHRARIMLRDRRIALVLALLAGWQLFQGAFTPYVDNWAHLGGAMAGFWLAWKLEPAMLEEG